MSSEKYSMYDNLDSNQKFWIIFWKITALLVAFVSLCFTSVALLELSYNLIYKYDKRIPTIYETKSIEVSEDGNVITITKM